MTVWRTRVACRITKATVTHSEYVVLIVFPLQQWLYESDSMLRYTYIDCIVKSASTNISLYTVPLPAFWSPS